jgi:hypothetical protein
MKNLHTAVGLLLTVAIVVLSHSAVAAKSAKPNSPPTAKKPASAVPETVKPFSGTDPVSKPRRIEINTRELQGKQPRFISPKH